MRHPSRGVLHTNTKNGTPIISEELGLALIAEIEEIVKVSVRALVAAGEDISELGPLGRCVAPDRDIANKTQTEIASEARDLDDLQLRQAVDACAKLMADALKLTTANTPEELVSSRADLLNVLSSCDERDFLKGFSQTLPSEEARHEFVTSGVAMNMLSHLKHIRTKLANHSSTLSQEVKVKTLRVLSSDTLQRLGGGEVTMKAVHVPKLIIFRAESNAGIKCGNASCTCAET